MERAQPATVIFLPPKLSLSAKIEEIVVLSIKTLRLYSSQIQLYHTFKKNKEENEKRGKKAFPCDGRHTIAPGARKGKRKRKRERKVPFGI